MSSTYWAIIGTATVFSLLTYLTIGLHLFVDTLPSARYLLALRNPHCTMRQINRALTKTAFRVIPIWPWVFATSFHTPKKKD